MSRGATQLRFGRVGNRIIEPSRDVKLDAGEMWLSPHHDVLLAVAGEFGGEELQAAVSEVLSSDVQRPATAAWDILYGHSDEAARKRVHEGIREKHTQERMVAAEAPVGLLSRVGNTV